MDFGVGGREAAERWLGVAERLLGARDLVGSKRFAERAMECYPLLDGVDQVLAVADVLLASQRRVNDHADWYAVLQLPPPSGDRRAAPVPDNPNTLAAVRRQYRRLSLLLDPDRNRCPGAESAFVLVADAYAVLADPVKRSLFEDELRAVSSADADSDAPAPDPAAKTFAEAASDDALDEVFWTVCTSCCHVHQYAIEYLNRSLRCTSCNRAFLATQLSAPPPIVPGTDMYYCAWGFFPLGFSGGPNIDLGGNWRPFYPMFPSDGKQPANAPAGGQQNQTQTPPAGSKKRMATKKVGRPRKKPLNDGNNEKAVGTVAPPDAVQGSGSRPGNLDSRGFTGININLGFDGSIGGGHGGSQGVNHPEPVNFHIDLDATDEIMGNLQNLPFLKDDGIPFRML